MSIDASILATIVHTLRVALAAGTPEDAERQKVARAYMVNLPRVPRFNTVSMMMNEAERAEYFTELLEWRGDMQRELSKIREEKEQHWKSMGECQREMSRLVRLARSRKV